MKKPNIIGAILVITGMALSAWWYDYKLVIILMIVLTGNNIEQHLRNK